METSASCVFRLCVVLRLRVWCFGFVCVAASWELPLRVCFCFMGASASVCGFVCGSASFVLFVGASASCVPSASCVALLCGFSASCEFLLRGGFCFVASTALRGFYSTQWLLLCSMAPALLRGSCAASCWLFAHTAGFCAYTTKYHFDPLLVVLQNCCMISISCIFRCYLQCQSGSCCGSCCVSRH